MIMLTPEDEYAKKVEDWGLKWITTPLDGTGINPISEVKYLLLLHRILKREKPDIVLSYTIKSNIYACLVSRLHSIPVVCNVSGLGTVFLVKGIAGKVAKLLYKLAFRSSKHIFFQNEDDKRLFTSHIYLDPQKVGLLPGSGINLTEFESVPLPSEEPVKFLMVSRLIIEKGVREYAEAASQFAGENKVTFTLVGRFDENHSRSIEKTDLDSWIEKGWISYYPHSDKIKELIASHDVVVLPSYREGTPRTLLEAAAMGRPLLASDVPGCKEVVEDGVNGFLFEVKNAKSLANKIALYLSLEGEERQKLSAASRALVEERFDESIVIERYDEVIRRIIKAT